MILCELKIVLLRGKEGKAKFGKHFPNKMLGIVTPTWVLVGFSIK